MLDVDHVEFTGWHLLVPFEHKAVNVLCCPKDVVCDGECQHGRSICCTDCVAPLCIECERQLHKRTPERPPAALIKDMMMFMPQRSCMS